MNKQDILSRLRGIALRASDVVTDLDRARNEFDDYSYSDCDKSVQALEKLGDVLAAPSIQRAYSRFAALNTMASDVEDRIGCLGEDACRVRDELARLIADIDTAIAADSVQAALSHDEESEEEPEAAYGI